MWRQILLVLLISSIGCSANGGRDVTLIGDNVAQGAEDELLKHGYFLHLERGRTMEYGYEKFIELRNIGLLKEIVFVSLGSNTDNNAIYYIDKIIENLPEGHAIIFQTPYNSHSMEGSRITRIRDHIRSLPAKYNYVTVADWAQHIHLFKLEDGVNIHNNDIAVNLYIRCVQDSIKSALRKPRKI